MPTCPKCGKEGREAVWRFKAKGHVYYYRVFVHPDGRKCVLHRVEPPKPAKTEVEELMRQVEQLRRENEELRRRVEEAEKGKAEAEARASIAFTVFAAGLRLGPRELGALRAMYIVKKNYTAEQREIARQVMHEIVSRGEQNGLAVVCFPEPSLLSL